MIRIGLRLIGDSLAINALRCHLLSEVRNKTTRTLSHVFLNKDLAGFSSIASSNVAIGEKGISDSPLVQSLIDSLQEFSLDEKEIKRIIEIQPTLADCSKSSWAAVIKLFLDSNFPKSNIYHILERCPELLSMKISTLNKALMIWIVSKISPGLYIEVVTHHPSFLTLDPQYVSKRIKQFQAYFEGKSRVGRLFLIAPSTMTESMSSILDKINYLDGLCREREEVVMSGVLDYSLFHIKARHEFLIRAGLYKRPTKSFDRRLDKNPKLEMIVNTTDKDFLKKLTPLSLFEYEVFLSLFKMELDSEIDSDSDSDHDEDHKFSYIMHKPKQKKKDY